MEEAVLFFGAVENLYVSIHFEISAKERPEHDQAIISARAALGDEAFAAAWESGTQMNFEEGITLALKEL